MCKRTLAGSLPISIVFHRAKTSVNCGVVNAHFLKADGDDLLAEVDLGVYPMAALLRVAHRFTDRCYLHLRHHTQTVIEVRFRAKSLGASLDTIAGEFCNEILDQALREIVASESESVRNLIMAHALSRSSFVNPELETAELPDSASETENN